jgi:hypothetical protein
VFTGIGKGQRFKHAFDFLGHLFHGGFLGQFG